MGSFKHLYPSFKKEGAGFYQRPEADRMDTGEGRTPESERAILNALVLKDGFAKENLSIPFL